MKDRKVLTCTVHPGKESQPKWLEIPRSLAACKFLFDKSQIAIYTYYSQQTDGNYRSKVLREESDQVDKSCEQKYSFVSYGVGTKQIGWL